MKVRLMRATSPGNSFFTIGVHGSLCTREDSLLVSYSKTTPMGATMSSGITRLWNRVFMNAKVR